MRLKNFIALYATAVTFSTCALQTSTTQYPENLSFNVQSSTLQHSKLKCLMLIINAHQTLEKIAHVVQFDVEFSDQIDVEAKRNKTELSAKTLEKLYDRGTSLCLYLKGQGSINDEDPIHVIATIKDPASNTVLFEKSFTCRPENLVYDAHKISDEIIPTLTGTKGPMLGTLAYCKQLNTRQKAICLADYACKTEKVVVKSKTINIAPRWHSHAPILFYSQFTRSNSRLMSLDMRFKAHRTICSYDGLNMQPSFSPDGTKAVLCLSGGGNAELYLYDQALFNALKKRVFQPITSNKGNNVSPCYLPNGDIVFCSDFQTGMPQIYLLDKATGQTKQLTNGKGYCAAPSYCAQNNSIVYTRYIKGVFQLFTLNVSADQPHEKQLTFNQGDKNEPTWSECGKYVAFSYGHRKPGTGKLTNQIAMLNTVSGKMRVLTTGKEHKSFPCWTNRSFYQI